MRLKGANELSPKLARFSLQLHRFRGSSGAIRGWRQACDGLTGCGGWGHDKLY